MKKRWRPLKPLNFHMAGLAQADQIVERICFLRFFKFSIRSFVVNRDSFADKKKAPLTSSAVSLNRQKSLSCPISATISQWPANIVCCFCAAFFRAERFCAFVGAKQKTLAASILPWFSRKLAPAFIARSVYQINPFRVFPSSHALACKLVRWLKPAPPFVAEFMCAGHLAAGHVRSTHADFGAKFSCLHPILWNKKLLIASLTGQCVHSSTINNDDASVLAHRGAIAIAALRTRRSAICIEKDAGYYDIMCKRVAAEQAQMRLAV